MKKLTLSIIFFLSVCYAGAQIRYSDEYGRVTPDELDMTEYAADKEAEALVIFEQGDYRFVREEHNNSVYFELNMTVRTKIKILHESGLEYANIEIPYYSASPDDRETVDVSGAIYNMVDGQVMGTPLNTGNIYDEVIRENRSVKKIAFPNVQVGSVIEYQYTIKTRRFFNIRPWKFQRTIPVRSSILTFEVNPFYEYAFILKAAEKFDIQSSVTDSFESQFLTLKYKNITYKLGMNNLPAFRDEEFLPNTDDYMVAVYFQMAKYYNYSVGQYSELMSTWPKLCDELLRGADFGKYVDGAAKEGKKVIASLGLAGKSDQEKIKAITNHVKSMYSWNGVYSFGASKKLNVFLKEKTGMAGDINLYLVGLLKAAGLNAEPVVLSIRSEGRIYKPYPFLNFFNCVVGMVKADGATYFVDAINPLTNFDEVSPQCANVEGLVVVKSNTEQWVPVIQNRHATEHNQVDIVIKPETGQTIVNLVQTTGGSSALRQRTNYNGNLENMKGPYHKRPGAVLQEVSVENFSEKDELFVCNYQYELGGEEASPEKIFLNPLQNIAPVDNPFKQTSRRHPVDVAYISRDSYAATVHVPEGYEVEHIPESKNRDHQGLKYSYVAYLEPDGQKIKINAEYTMLNYFDAKEYPLLKDFYGDVVNKLSEAVILRKID